MIGSVLGVLAAVFQISGYLLYIRNFLRRSIRPNAASYLMFAYGTSLVAFLAWQNGAVLAELLLLFACAGMSVIVALMCLRKNATEPVDRFEAIIFSADLWLTIGFAVMVFADVDKAAYAAVFLFLGNVTTLTSFMPILRSTWRDPRREQPLPWIVWSLAYIFLTAATLVTTGLDQPVLLMYPVANVVLHVAMALFSLRKTLAGRYFGGGGSFIYHDTSPIAGEGVFAGRPFAAGEKIWTMTGTVYGNSRTGQDPDFVGLGPGLWMDPDPPLNKLNHSCEPNACFGPKRQLFALRPIAKGEEITFDYSTSEVDPQWTMACDCRAKGCRRGLHAIQISFADRDEPPPASPLMQLLWKTRRVKPTQDTAFPQLGQPARPVVPGGIDRPPARRSPQALRRSGAAPSRNRIGAR
ncbi:SET domain-containing protein [Aquisediminimonas profunda]|uniref:SET domain-containing protein n=1 Tax=Aquisediminimonas profunda TaxID=1550733 RepID=UPI001C630F02|nr:SET domain-containing protein [Aquisediminimonas profunda]